MQGSQVFTAECLFESQNIIDDPEVGRAEETLVRNEIMDSVYRVADEGEER